MSLAGNAIASPAMRWGLLLMTLACWMYAITMTLIRVRAIIREREHDTAWMAEAGSKS